MKRILVSMIVAAAVVTHAGCASAPMSAPPPDATVAPPRLVEGHARYLLPGEELRYDVAWHFITIGEIRFTTRLGKGDAGETLVVDSITAPTPLAALLARYGGRAVSTFARDTLLTQRYFWHNVSEGNEKRRYGEVIATAGKAIGVEIGPDYWSTYEIEATAVWDPVSALFVLRVVELAPNEEAHFHIFDGKKLRLCTIRRLGTDARPPRRLARTPAVGYAFRVDPLDDEGSLTGEDPETDVVSWVSDDERRVVLSSRGEIKGRSVSIRLVDRRAPENLESSDRQSSAGTRKTEAEPPSSVGPTR